MSHCAQYPYLNPTQFNTLYTEIRGKVWKAPLLKDCDVSTYQSPFCPSDSSAAAQAKDRSAVGTSPSGCWVVRVWKHLSGCISAVQCILRHVRQCNGCTVAYRIVTVNHVRITKSVLLVCQFGYSLTDHLKTDLQVALSNWSQNFYSSTAPSFAMDLWLSPTACVFALFLLSDRPSLSLVLTQVSSF